jgi:hypothetical protein
MSRSPRRAQEWIQRGARCGMQALLFSIEITRGVAVLCLSQVSELSMKHVLAEQPDFKNEPSAMEMQFAARGDVLLMSVKGHPEIAGKGIEYSWGCSKKYFRKINDCKPTSLHENIKKSMSENNLPLSRVRKFARKAREFARLYYECRGTCIVESHAAVEGMYKKRKTHRSALDMFSNFVDAPHQ